LVERESANSADCRSAEFAVRRIDERDAMNAAVRAAQGRKRSKLVSASDLSSDRDQN
jgi:hypothetical protein